MPRSLPLLIEIGSEEIPARFAAEAQREFGERLHRALQQLRLLPEGAGAMQTYSTPRRLVARVRDVLDRQPDKTEEVLGPPLKVAFDADGKPTRAAESFAEKNATTPRRLTRVETPKGLYLAARKRLRGRPAREVLAEALPEIVLGIGFPKSMYWTSKDGPRFIRPIRWLLALQGEGEDARVVKFEIAGVKSGNTTFGHRVAGGGRIRVRNFEEYRQSLRVHHVDLDPDDRRKKVLQDLKVLLDELDLHTIEDPDLFEWVVNSTEWPKAIVGGFDRRFLHLPREILVTVMRDHQKYFAVEDRESNLQPRFVTVMNLGSDPGGVVRRGHERVLTARFADAEFFWDSDQRIPLRDRLPLLERVTYQAKLGSYGDKTRRMEAIAREICSSLEGLGKLTAEGSAQAFRAVCLCKCDLTTQMVQEFTELQGVVGGLYARQQGEPAPVADAIYDHYKPVNLEDRCPQSAVGAVVALADKLDSVVAGFAAGIDSTGSSDPFGLRRAGNGIIKIAMEVLTDLNLRTLLGAVAGMDLGLPPASDLPNRLEGFLRERTEHYLQSCAGLRYDTVRAVVGGFKGWSPPSETLQRGKALERVRDMDDFQALAAAAKRTRNILSKSAKEEDFGTAKSIDPQLFSLPEERDLYAGYEKIRATLDGVEARSDYRDGFMQLARLRPLVDRFFDKVLVMDEDAAVRSNRLRLLTELNTLAFLRYADLAQIESNASTSVDTPTPKSMTGPPQE